jgi:hypothetical protein
MANEGMTTAEVLEYARTLCADEDHIFRGTPETTGYSWLRLFERASVRLSEVKAELADPKTSKP